MASKYVQNPAVNYWTKVSVKPQTFYKYFTIHEQFIFLRRKIGKRNESIHEMH